MTDVTFVFDKNVLVLHTKIQTVPKVGEYVILTGFLYTDTEPYPRRKELGAATEAIWNIWTKKGFVVEDVEWTYGKAAEGYFSESCKIFLAIV